MPHVDLRLYGELGDFVPPRRRGRAFDVPIDGRPAVKDVIESVGPPHCEVFLVLVKDEPVDFARRVREGDRIAAYPHFATLPVEDVVSASPPLPRDGRFVLDGHLGRLAAYLRALGFDVAHDRDADDAVIARTAATESRVLLTRDLALLKRGIVLHGRFVRATRPNEQLVEILRRFALEDLARPFTRCLRCNTPLVDAPQELVASVVPPGVRARFTQFAACPACRRAYWQGSHHDRLLASLDGALRASRGSAQSPSS